MCQLWIDCLSVLLLHFVLLCNSWAGPCKHFSLVGVILGVVNRGTGESLQDRAFFCFLVLFLLFTTWLPAVCRRSSETHLSASFSAPQQLDKLWWTSSGMPCPLGQLPACQLPVCVMATSFTFSSSGPQVTQPVAACRTTPTYGTMWNFTSVPAGGFLWTSCSLKNHNKLFCHPFRAVASITRLSPSLGPGPFHVCSFFEYSSSATGVQAAPCTCYS